MTGTPSAPEPRPGPKADPKGIPPKDTGSGAGAPAARPDATTATFHRDGESALMCGPASSSIPVDLLHHPRYHVLEYVGCGGMGCVYKAIQVHMGRLVALKVINPSLVDRPAMVNRFRQEVRAVARLSHPNIVAAYEADHAGPTQFLAMEFVEGVDLDRVLKERGALPVAEACDYARQTALGLQHAWERGMVHRDIKPHNLMLTPQRQVKILDFGLARFVSEGVPDGATAGKGSPGGAGAPCPVSPKIFKGTAYAYTGAGTADYMAPEEAMNASRADIRADIYSLGCTLYRCLAGQVPFPEGDLLDKLRCHLEQEPAPLSCLRGDLPVRLVQVVERMMAKEPGQRHQIPAEVAQALASFATAVPRPILVVDDDFALREAMVLVLENEGYPVACASNGQEALDWLWREAPPSLILLDLMMPVMDGLQFLEEQRQDPLLANIPVVIISAANRGHVQAIALGAADYLQKPIRVEELAAKVQDLAAS